MKRTVKKRRIYETPEQAAKRKRKEARLEIVQKANEHLLLAGRRDYRSPTLLSNKQINQAVQIFRHNSLGKADTLLLAGYRVTKRPIPKRTLFITRQQKVAINRLMNEGL